MAAMMEPPAGGGLRKAPTGIVGLDEVTGGGLPAGRPTLVAGSAGSGKTLLAMEVLVHGASRCGEPGVFFAFEESSDELAQNVRSLGFDVDDLVRRRLLTVEYVHVEPSEIQETGAYDLEGLFIRLGFAIDSIGAKRVALDTLEILFGGLGNESILRSELRRLFRWLKARELTTVITAERGDGTITRNGLEEYVSDCVILLDHRVINQVATRRLRVVKYRGSAHGTNEYPFLIDADGLHVVPITAVGLDHPVVSERVSSGVQALDTMLDGGYYRGSSILISGTAGTGKSSIAAHFVAAACRRGERSIYFSFEESRAQVVRNMRSIGIDLEPYLEDGTLVFHAARPTSFGLESHLAAMHRAVRAAEPKVVVIDPVMTFLEVGAASDVKALVTQLADFLKARQITVLLTSLTSPGASLEQTDVGISSLIDTWLVLCDFETAGERNRGLYVIKSRGTRHSNQVREFLLTDQGIELLDVSIGPDGILLGSARVAEEARRTFDTAVREQEITGRRRDLELKRRTMEARIATLAAEFKAEEEQLDRLLLEESSRRDRTAADRSELARRRQGSGGGRSTVQLPASGTTLTSAPRSKP